MKEIKLFHETVSIPTTPNFILKNGMATEIGYFTVSALKKIAKEWERNLLEKAEKSFKRLNS